MTDLPSATASPVDFKVGDKTLQLYPLSIGDQAHLLKFIQEAIRADAREATKGEDVPEALRSEIMSEAITKSWGLTLQSDDYGDYLSRPDVLVRTLWLSLRRGQPDLKEASVDGMIGSLGNGTEAVGKVWDITIPEGAEKNLKAGKAASPAK